MGAGVVIAREIGAGDATRIAKAVHTTVAMGLFISVLINVLGVAFSPLMLRLIGRPDTVFALANTYLRIYFLGSPTGVEPEQVYIAFFSLILR